MTGRTSRLVVGKTLAAMLMAGTALGGAALAADPDLEARVSALEAKLDRILRTLETGDAALGSADTAVLQEVAALAVDVRPAVQQTALLELDTPGGVSAQKSAEPAPALDGFRVGDTTFKMKGFVKLDASVTDFSGGELPSGNIGRDFYIPALIPVGGSGDGPDVDFNARETRFLFTMDTEAAGLKVGGLIELDFMVTDGGDERVSNSYVPRIRQGYVTIDKWLLGQAWSTFQDVVALPDNLDFIGPTEGTVFIRQPMVRYRNGPWEIALEEPETEITTAAGGRVLPGDDIAPDLVVRYTKRGAFGHVALAGLLRALHVEDGVVPGAVEDTALGYGVSLSGKLNVGARDDFRFMATVGDGVGRYIGVNVVNDAGVDADGELAMIKTYSGFASYRRFWTPKWRSNLTGGYFKADNPTALVGLNPTDQVYSAHVNLIYSPIDKIDVGVEYIYANRRLESGVDGDMNKVQFSTKYSF